MIHTCPKRLWYVYKYLIPSLIQQNIARDSIIIHLDCNNAGALESFVLSANKCVTEDGGTWHLQDDILICRDFREKTESFDEGIVCGIATEYDRERKNHHGRVQLHQMWYSFPCIRIPDKIMREFADWYLKYFKTNVIYKHIVRSGKHDDMVFRMFLEATYEENELLITNMKPNLVEHVDWLIGGSTINYHRDKPIRALYFDDEELVSKLRERLCDGKNVL